MEQINEYEITKTPSAVLRNPMTTSPNNNLALQKGGSLVTSSTFRPPSLPRFLLHFTHNQLRRFILIARNANKSGMVERHTLCIRNENNEIERHSLAHKRMGRDKEKQIERERESGRVDKVVVEKVHCTSERKCVVITKMMEWRAQKCNEYKTRSRILEKHVLTLFRCVYVTYTYISNTSAQSRDEIKSCANESKALALMLDSEYVYEN